MRINIILSAIFVAIIGLNPSFAQENAPSDLSNKPVFILKLSNGAGKITRDPILLAKQCKNCLISIPRDSFFKQHPEIKGTNVFAIELEPGITKLLNLNDIFNQFNIKDEYRSLPVITEGLTSVDKKSIYATENSIKSVTVDKNKKVIVIKLIPDNTPMR
jgi:hypothetical protein